MTVGDGWPLACCCARLGYDTAVLTLARVLGQLVFRAHLKRVKTTPCTNTSWLAVVDAVPRGKIGWGVAETKAFCCCCVRRSVRPAASRTAAVVQTKEGEGGRRSLLSSSPRFVKRQYKNIGVDVMIASL